MKHLTVRVLFFIVGLIIISFGVSLTIKADLGAGAWDAVNVGLSTMTGLTVGNWVIIIGLILMFVNACLAKERPDYAALITIVIIGVLIDFWLYVVMQSWAFSMLILQASVLLIGVLFIGFGVSIYIQPKLSLNPVDGLMVALQKRFNISLLIAKTITEVLALLLAWLFGGPVGVGTFLIILSIGPAIQLFEPVAKKMMHTFEKRNVVANKF